MSRHSHPALTLVELLVVVSIMVILAAITVPSLKPMLKGQQMRSSAQSVSEVLQRARIRAIEKNETTGVRLIRYTGGMGEHYDAAISMQLYRQKTEASQRLASDIGVYVRNGEISFYQYRVIVNSHPTPNELVWDLIENTTNNNDAHDALMETIFPCERAYVGSRPCRVVGNRLYDAFGIPVNYPENMDDRYPPNTSLQPYHPDKDDNMPTRISTAATPGIQPPTTLHVISTNTRPLLTAPTPLTEGTVIDLTWSGVTGGADACYCTGRPSGYVCPGNYDCFCKPNAPTGASAGNGDITIMFSPQGGVDYIFYGNDLTRRFVPGELIHLLVGEADQLNSMGSMREDPVENFELETNYWVTLEPRTGKTAITKVNPAAVDRSSSAPPLIDQLRNNNLIIRSRRNAEAFYFDVGVE